MKIEIKKSINPVKYNEAINFLEARLLDIENNKAKDLIWILEHEEIYTAGTSHNSSEVLNKKIKLIKTNRVEKLHIMVQANHLLFRYWLKKRNKDIRKFITLIEKTIIETLSEFEIKSFGDPENIGIWLDHKKEIKKIAAIGIRISKWIAYHGFAINVNNDLLKYNNIIPCGIYDKGVTNLKEINDQNYKELSEILIKNFTKNLET